MRTNTQTMMAEGLTTRNEFQMGGAAAQGAFLTTADELAARARTVPAKHDCHGLGFCAPTTAGGASLHGLVAAPVRAETRRVTIGESLRSRGAHAGAFGVGALEEPDGDLDDVYDQGSWELYDREIGEPVRKKREGTETPLPAAPQKVQSAGTVVTHEMLQPALSSTGRVLRGFVRAQRPDSDVFRQWFPPPVVPPDFVPVHRFLKPVIARLSFFPHQSHVSASLVCVCMTSARGNPEPHDAADARTITGRANSTTAAASTKTTTSGTDCITAFNQVCTFDQHAVVDGDCTGTAHGSGICACATPCCSRCTSTRTAQAAVCACDARDACVGACASPVQALWRSCARHHCRC